MASRDEKRAAFEKMKALKEGEKRSDQYVVKENPSILKEVDDEEYQRLRSDDFVVGDKDHGYRDTGKEIWDEAAKERASSAQGRARGAGGGGKRQAGGAGASAKRSALAKGSTSDEAASSKHVLQALNAGAHAGSGGVASTSSLAAGGKDAHRQKELDSMLADMCNMLDATEAPAPAVKSEPGAGKRKSAESAAAGKKRGKTNKAAPAGDVADVEMAPVPVKKEDGGMAAVKVKQEREEPVTGAVSQHAAGQDVVVKREPASPEQGATAIGKIKLELTGSDGKTVSQSQDAPKRSSVFSMLQSSGSASGDSKVDSLASTANSTAVKQEPIVKLEPGVASNSGGQFKLEEDGGMWFFFIDAFEDDRASPPRVYLFGKVQSTVPGQYQTCCLVVEGIERCVHLLLNVPDVNALDENAFEADEEKAKARAAQQEVAKAAESEFDSLCRQQCPNIQKLRATLKWRNYAFEKPLAKGGGNLPFLKVVCDTSSQMPPQGMKGKSFTHLFGANTSLVERLLITRRIMGPSWLRLDSNWQEQDAKLSFCKVELRIKPATIVTPKQEDARRTLEADAPRGSPPLRILSIHMQTVQRSAQQPHEPVAVVCTMHPKVNPDLADSDQELRAGMQAWAAIRRIDSSPLPRDSEQTLKQNSVENFSSEAALLNAVLAKIHDFDPDVIAGYNAYGFELDVLANRMHSLKLNSWQKLGRLRRSGARMPRVEGRQGNGFWLGSNLTNGRLVCDLMLQAKDLLPKLQTYDLPTLAKSQLNEDSVKVVEPENLPRFYDSAKELVSLANLTFQSAFCIARIVHNLQILPLTRQLTNIGGNLWNGSLQNKRAERNEMLLCHEFHKGKFVLPDKESILLKKRRAQGDSLATGLDDADGDNDQAPAAGTGPRRGKAAYSGGLVLEPKVGLYEDFVLLLDFNSLYPSIIQEHNICFTTVDRPDETQVPQCNTEAELLSRTSLPDGTGEEGVLPQVLKKLVESRATVKMAIKSESDPKRLKMLDIRQKALKLTANSMYGCLGFQNSRFFAKPLAALITAKGREALQTTITVVTQELQLDVVYGDTDSVFVNSKTTDYNAAMQVAQQIKRSVNKRYKRLEIEIDGVFGRLMLLKKKKYAAVKVIDWKEKKFEKEIKGLDIVRRDWCKLAKEMGEEVLNQVLGGEGKEEAVNWIHNYLTEKAREMDERTLPIEQYVITKGLTKDPKDYPDAKNQPHVQVALRLQSRGVAVRAGQEIGYVICEPQGTDGAKANVSDRARHPHEFTLDATLRVDIEWYKKQQVHPLISRTLAPVEGTDAGRLAECLGMDGTRFALAAARAAEDGSAEAAELAAASAASADVNALFDRQARFKEYQSNLPGIQCLKCKTTTAWKDLLQPQAAEEQSKWGNGLVNEMFRCSNKECREPINPRRAQNVLTIQIRELLKDHCMCWVRCEDANIEKTRRLNRGVNMTSERTVLKELEYVDYLCENSPTMDVKDNRGCVMSAANMRRHARNVLEYNGYNWVDTGALFSGMFSGGGTNAVKLKQY